MLYTQPRSTLHHTVWYGLLKPIGSARRYVSVHSVICDVYIGVILRDRVCRWLCSDFVLWQIIYICTNNWKTLWNAFKPETCLKSSNQYTKWWISIRIARKHQVKCICLYLYSNKYFRKYLWTFISSTFRKLTMQERLQN